MLKQRLSLCILILFLFGLITGCEEKDPLLGKWQEPNSGITMQFGENNDLTMSDGETSMVVTYTKQEPNTLIIKASTDGSIPDQTMTYRFEEENLILTVDGSDTLFIKAK